jgi:hypothetical protein
VVKIAGFHWGRECELEFNDNSAGDFSSLARITRRVKPVDSSTRGAEYRAIDKAGYLANGAYSHDKPVDGQSQFRLQPHGTVPAPAFGMRPELSALFLKQSRFAGALGEPVDRVLRHGAALFDGVWGEVESRLEARIEAGSRKIAQLQAELSAVSRERDSLRRVAEAQTEVRFPKGPRLVALVGVAFLWLLVVGSEWTNAAKRLEPQYQDLVTCFLATSPFVCFGLMLEFLFVRALSPLARRWEVLFHGITWILVLAYVGIFGANYSLILVDGSMLGNGWQRALYALQLLCGIAASACLAMMAWHLMVPVRAIVLNEDYTRLQKRADELVEAINNEECFIGKARGHLKELISCREAFLELGIRAWQVAPAERDLLERERRLLDG